MINILTSKYSTGIEGTLNYLGISCNLFVVKGIDDDLSKFKDINIVYFGGGADVHPLFYGEKNESSQTQIERDMLEFCIFQKFLTNPEVKYAGICRGSQFLNVCYGGSLYQDLGYKGHNYIHEVRQDREYPETLNLPYLGKYGIEDNIFTVNSTHHQAVKVLGNGLQRLLYEPKTGVTEGFFSVDGKTRALQSHPEFMDENYKYSLQMLKYLFRIGE